MSEIEKSSAALVTAWRGSMTATPPGGESIASMEKRVRQSLNDLLGEFQGGAVALVAHMMPLRAIASIAMNMPNAGYWSLQFEPCSVSVFRFFGGELCEVFSLNSCEHLPQG
jgi:probable phosphoglycerate mutase